MGVISFYKSDFRNGTAFLAVLLDGVFRRQGRALEALVPFIDYGFRTFGYRKLYIEALDFNFNKYSSVLKLGFIEEGRLLEYERFDDSLCDLIFASLSATDWLARAELYRSLVGSDVMRNQVAGLNVGDYHARR
jgi:RimJ/RimL family protein N-acetyltransferase